MTAGGFTLPYGTCRQRLAQAKGRLTAQLLRQMASAAAPAPPCRALEEG